MNFFFFFYEIGNFLYFCLACAFLTLVISPSISLEWHLNLITEFQKRWGVYFSLLFSSLTNQLSLYVTLYSFICSSRLFYSNEILKRKQDRPFTVVSLWICDLFSIGLSFNIIFPFIHNLIFPASERNGCLGGL